MLKIGLKIGSRDTGYTEEILKYYEEGVFQYIELFAVPGSYKETIDYWKEFHIPFGIHAPHSASGVNLASRLSRYVNKDKVAESFRFADDLKADYVIFHSGTNGICVEVVEQLRHFRDPRMLIENKPLKGIGGGLCVGSHIEELKYIIESLDAGFCLDFGHAICASNSLCVESLDFIKELNTLKPRLYHLTDGDYKSELDSHLHYGKGTFPLKELLEIVPDGYRITNEAKREKLGLSEIKEDNSYIRKLKNDRT